MIGTLGTREESLDAVYPFSVKQMMALILSSSVLLYEL